MGDDESLNKNTTACFVKTMSHLSNSAKVEKTCSGSGEDMLGHDKTAVYFVVFQARRPNNPKNTAVALVSDIVIVIVNS